MGESKFSVATAARQDEDEEINISLTVMKTIATKVKKSDTVRKVKAILKDKEGISESLQEVSAAGYGLQDDKKLDRCGNQQNSNLPVFVRDSVPMRLFIKKASDHRILETDAATCDTIHDLKRLIEIKERIPSDNFSLFFSGKTLNDNETSASVNIKGKSTIHMVLRPRDVLPISVKMPDGELLKMLYTVRDVKAIAESIVGSPLNDSSLFYDGKKLDDSKVLSCYNITAESTFEMLAQKFFQISVSYYGYTIILDVHQDCLIKAVKDKIFHSLGFPVDSQTLE